MSTLLWLALAWVVLPTAGLLTFGPPWVPDDAQDAAQR